MSEQHRDDDQALDAFGPLKDGPEHVRRIIEKVLTLEQEHLYQRAPRILDDVLRVIRDAVR